jgi:hypothetical protein
MPHHINSPCPTTNAPIEQPPPSRKRPHTQSQDQPALKSKRSAVIGEAQKPSVELGEYIDRDVALLQRLGWKEFIRQRRDGGDLAHLDNVHHPARRLLKLYQRRGAPVKFKTGPWSRQRINQAIKRGPHKSCMEHIDFLKEEFVEMIGRGQWVVLPAKVARTLPHLRVSPPGVVPQRERRPRWICDYTWSDVNSDTLPLAAAEAMQFGHALDRILREILLADPRHGPVKLAKFDISDGFYRIDVNIDDIPKLGVVFPTLPGEEPLIAFPLVLPMGWKNSPPIFSSASETSADLANQRIHLSAEPSPHHLDELAESVTPPPPETAAPSSTTLNSTPIPVKRDPSLPTSDTPLGYVDVFVDDFVGLAQTTPHSRRVRRILLHAIDDVFRPLQPGDNPYRQEPVSLKKLRKGDCSWSTIKLVLGWVIDTTAMTIHLPQHRVDRLVEILSSIPPHQKRTSVKKWHSILGELRSMSLALPGSRHMFSRLQNALSQSDGNRIALKKGVHQALNDFKWLANDVSGRPTRLAEVIPLLSSAEGHHDASGIGAGGVWFPGSTLHPRKGFKPNIPVIWRLKWPEDIVSKLVTSSNRSGTITNSDLELAGGLLHLEALCQSFDIRERTILSKGDNLSTTFWERKGSTTTDSAPAYLLRLFGIHQRYHRYVPRFDYISGPSNPIADAASRDFHLTFPQLFSQLQPFFSQNVGYQVWTPSKPFVSAVISALHRKQCSRESLLAVPSPPTQLGHNGSSSQITWASTPFSKPSRTKYQSYKSSPTEFVVENLQQTAIPSGLDRLKITYGTLPRRSFTWGPRIPA